MDINDRFILKKEHIKNRDYEKISKFSKKYKLEEIIIVIAKSNSKKTSFELILLSEEKIIEKTFLLNQHEYETFFKILKSETLNIWKIINSIQNNSINMINCKINYFNNLELKEIRKNLNNISIIQNLNIKSLSFKNIEYDIYFYGNLKILNNIFKMNKLDLNESKNQCVIRLK